MIKVINTSATILFSAMFVLGCSSGGGGSGDGATGGTSGDTTGDTMGTTTETTGSTTQTTGATTQTTGATTQTTGNTNGGGYADGVWLSPCEDIGGGEYEVTTITFNGSSIVSTSFSYSDAACAVPMVPAEFEGTFSVVYTGGTTNTPEGAAQHIDVTITEAKLDGVVQDMVGDFAGTDYDIVLVSGSTLRLGLIDDVYDGESPATRPIALDPEEIFTRQ